MTEFITSTYSAIPTRKLDENTCKHFKYGVGEYRGKNCHVANFYDLKGKLVGQKIRLPGKKFTIIGDVTSHLYGMQLWKDGGKRVVITEGELDALSYSQVTNSSWPVVSIPNGAQGAAKTLKANIEWLEKFDEVVLAFDNDEPGQTAASECAALLTPGKAKLASLHGYKDFSEALQAEDNDAILKAVWHARTYRPDGVLDSEGLWDAVATQKVITTAEYPWSGLNSMTRGLREGELVVLTAGTGIGKSAICREIAYDLGIRQGKKVGLMFLEESARRTALGLLGIHVKQPLHLDPDFNAHHYHDDFKVVFGSDRFFVFDHFGSMDIENLLNRIRFLRLSCGCNYIILDHLSIVLSGLEVQDERRAVDVAMTKLRTIVEQTGVGLILVSHLRRMHGDESHETGSVPQLSQLRGSHGIAQLADMVLAASRNQQAEPGSRNKTRLHVLKNRFSGDTGFACHLTFDSETYRLLEAATNPDEIDEEDPL